MFPVVPSESRLRALLLHRQHWKKRSKTFRLLFHFILLFTKKKGGLKACPFLWESVNMLKSVEHHQSVPPDLRITEDT
jgi:hypothetical protein